MGPSAWFGSFMVMQRMQLFFACMCVRLRVRARVVDALHTSFLDLGGWLGAQRDMAMMAVTVIQ